MTSSFHNTGRGRIPRFGVIGRDPDEHAYREAFGWLATLAGARAGGGGR